MKLLHTLINALLLGLIFFPVLRWYGLRLGDGQGEPLGLLALGMALILACRDRHAPSTIGATLSLALYGIGFFLLPPLLRAIPALATLAFLTGMHRSAGQSALLFLSLPLQASLDFFLGYPCRLVTSEGARLLLNAMGQKVERLGVQLTSGSQIVSVDPACSGIQMLWTVAFFTAILAALFRLGHRDTLLLGLAAFILTLLANTLRATVLFFPEAGLFELSDLLHEGVGIAFFLIAALFLAGLARRFQSHPQERPGPQVTVPLSFTALATLVLLVTLVPQPTHAASTSPVPALRFFQGQPVTEIPLSDREEAFAKDFPGNLRVYRAGEGTLIVRHVNRATRQLHPSRHCLRAEGYLIQDSQLMTDENGRETLRYRATRHDREWLVTEIITDAAQTRSWTEVSAWYWHALFHSEAGPWEARTFLTPIQ